MKKTRDKHRIGGIYTITNILDNKMYIGYALYIKRRWSKHLYFLRKNNHHNFHLQRAWNKYGEENFKFDVLEECREDLLPAIEHYWCITLNATNSRFGYNIKSTHPNDKPCNYSKEAMSEETKNKIRVGNLGKVVSKESRNKIAKAFMKPIVVIDNRGNLVRYSSTKEYSHCTGIRCSSISKVLNRKNNKYRGNIFLFENEYLNRGEIKMAPYEENE